MKKIEELNSALFVYESHVNDYGACLDLSYSTFTPIAETYATELHAALRKYAIGYCKGECLPFKPMPGYVGIMCEKDGEKFWFHILQSTLDCINSEGTPPRGLD